MGRLYPPACLALCVVLFGALPLNAGDGPALAEGNWMLTTAIPPSYQELTFCIFKVENKDGKQTASVLATYPTLKDMALEHFAVEKDSVQVKFKSRVGEFAFEGRVSPKSNKTVLGTLDENGRLTMARLTATDLATLQPKDFVKQPDLPPLKQLMTLNQQVLRLRAQALRENDADKKAELVKQANEASKEVMAQTPKFQEEVLEKYADHPAALGMALTRIRTADPDRVKKLVEIVEKVAAPYGPRLERQTQAELAGVLVSLPKSKEFALEYTQRVSRALTEKDPASIQVQLLKALQTAQTKSNKTAEAKQTAVQIAKLELVLDAEYLRKVPPFQPETFKGRSGKGSRPVVMELFTGSQCPPCVAADVAFDALEKSFKPSELILIEYHLHIPGPDPLTNKDSEARWEYYRKAFPADVRGTPTTVFNGKPQAGGGGGMAQAQSKYQEYRKIIDPLVETPDAVKLTASAARMGNKLDIRVEVSDLKIPGENKKLRLVLVEESIRYVGGNKIRFHHQVVRALPGGADGIVLKEKTSTQTVSVDLGQVKEGLTRYLDDYAKKRPFANPDRPLDLKKLHVIALVQDDQTQEILQGLQVKVTGDMEQ